MSYLRSFSCVTQLVSLFDKNSKNSSATILSDSDRKQLWLEAANNHDKVEKEIIETVLNRVPVFERVFIRQYSRNATDLASSLPKRKIRSEKIKRK